MAIHRINIKTDDLTEDQKIIYNSEIKIGNNVSVEGGPGTGKTILLFLLAEKVKKLGKDYRIITLQNNLKNFLKYSFGKLNEKYILNAWGTSYPDEYPEQRGFIYELANHLNGEYPKNYFRMAKEDQKKYLVDLISKVKIDKELKNIYEDKVIFVDEAQDLPEEYFLILKELFGTIYIFGDDKQNISSGCNFSGIKKILGIDRKNQFSLDINFRNSIQIYNFAKLTGFKEEDIEVKNNSSKVEIIKGLSSFDLEIKKIKEIISDNIGSNIAIITSYGNIKNYRGKFWSEMQFVDRNNYIDLKGYNNFCLNFNNNKGLEFDVVIITGFTKDDFFTKNMYVSVTRTGYNKNTRNGWKLYIFSEDIDDYLPEIKNNENILILNYSEKSEIDIIDIPF